MNKSNKLVHLIKSLIYMAVFIFVIKNDVINITVNFVKLDMKRYELAKQKSAEMSILSPLCIHDYLNKYNRFYRQCKTAGWEPTDIMIRYIEGDEALEVEAWSPYCIDRYTKGLGIIEECQRINWYPEHKIIERCKIKARGCSYIDIRKCTNHLN
ncbi:MAG: hypothetical protein AAFQ80_07170 [Cyanobacteria bacterium J06621_8]